MKRTVTLGEEAEIVIETLHLPGASFSACVDRLLTNLFAICEDADNYAQHFGPQHRKGHEPPDDDTTT